MFDIVGKLGEGSYGSVFKALHKDSKQILAIKQVSHPPYGKHALNDNILGAGGHRSAGHNQRDQYHATMRLPLRGQILWLLLQKHRSLDCHGVLRCWQCFRYNEVKSLKSSFSSSKLKNVHLHEINRLF